MTETAVERWHWTVSRYYQAAEAGVFGPEPRVELIDGEVYTMASMLPGHASAVRRLVKQLYDHLDDAEWTVHFQMPIHLDDISEPEPDVCVARGPAGRYDTRHPSSSDVLLVVEVSGTSLTLYRTVKLPKYARSGIVEVWIVSLPERAIHRFTDPRPASATYNTAQTFGPGARIAGTTLPLHLSVDDILPRA